MATLAVLIKLMNKKMYENVSISQVHFRSEMDMSKVNITSRIVVHSDRVGTASQ